MRIVYAAILLMVSVSCKSTSQQYHARPTSFVVPSFDEEGGAEDGDDTAALHENSCTQDAASIRCVRFVKNDDAKSVVIELPPTHPQAGKKVTIMLAGIEPLELKANEICERQAAQKAKRRMTQALETAKRIDVTKLVRVKPQALQADVQIDGHSLAGLLQEEKLVRALGSRGKADWCEMPSAN
jgi:hypothetical protein